MSFFPPVLFHCPYSLRITSETFTVDYQSSVGVSFQLGSHFDQALGFTMSKFSVVPIATQRKIQPPGGRGFPMQKPSGALVTLVTRSAGVTRSVILHLDERWKLDS